MIAVLVFSLCEKTTVNTAMRFLSVASWFVGLFSANLLLRKYFFDINEKEYMGWVFVRIFGKISANLEIAAVFPCVSVELICISWGENAAMCSGLQNMR